jgi:hypothetical protein
MRPPAERGRDQVIQALVDSGRRGHRRKIERLGERFSDSVRADLTNIAGLICHRGPLEGHGEA